MKKFILAAAALVAGLAANATVYDFTGTVTSTCTPGTDYTVLLCNGSGSYTDGGDATVAGLTLYAKNNDATKEGFRFNYAVKKAGQNGLVGNSGDLCIELDLTAGDVVRVQYTRKGGSAANFLNTGKSTPLGKGSDLGAAAFNLTADAGNVSSTAKDNVVIEKFTANSTGKAYLFATNADIYKISINEDIATAVNETAAEGDKEVIARVGLVNVYNDGSKELAK